jgi:hypothetical protein
MLVYCDSVILMYYFDHTGPFNLRVMRRLAALAAAGDRIAISDLVRLEYRVLPPWRPRLFHASFSLLGVEPRRKD